MKLWASEIVFSYCRHGISMSISTPVFYSTFHMVFKHVVTYTPKTILVLAISDFSYIH